MQKKYIASNGVTGAKSNSQEGLNGDIAKGIKQPEGFTVFKNQTYCQLRTEQDVRNEVSHQNKLLFFSESSEWWPFRCFGEKLPPRTFNYHETGA